jgi:hypothetical protein
MEILILNDGTELNGHILDDGEGRAIFVYLDNMSVYDGVMLFADKEKTSKIKALNHGTEHEYTGFTQLWSVSQEFGNCNIVMRKGRENAS